MCNIRKEKQTVIEPTSNIHNEFGLHCFVAWELHSSLEEGTEKMLLQADSHCTFCLGGICISFYCPWLSTLFRFNNMAMDKHPMRSFSEMNRRQKMKEKKWRNQGKPWRVAPTYSLKPVSSHNYICWQNSSDSAFTSCWCLSSVNALTSFQGENCLGNK